MTYKRDIAIIVDDGQIDDSGHNSGHHHGHREGTAGTYITGHMPDCSFCSHCSDL